MSAIEHDQRERVLKRRKLAVRIGLGLLLTVTVTACIFDKGDYQGGGRVDKGATAATAPSDTASTMPTDTTAPTDTTQPTGLDASMGQDSAGIDAADGG